MPPTTWLHRLSLVDMSLGNSHHFLGTDLPQTVLPNSRLTLHGVHLPCCRECDSLTTLSPMDLIFSPPQHPASWLRGSVALPHFFSYQSLINVFSVMLLNLHPFYCYRVVKQYTQKMVQQIQNFTPTYLVYKISHERLRLNVLFWAFLSLIFVKFKSGNGMPNFSNVYFIH